MSYVAEPYGLFVDDLLTALTGGRIRETFRYLAEEEPFRLRPATAILPSTVRIHGTSGGRHQVFQRGRDFELLDGIVVSWKRRVDGTPLGQAVLPDLGSRFWVNYEERSLVEAHPQLTDRNQGSVTRLLAESFAREYAVLSGQLEAVYRSAFVDTAEGRDLDQIAALVGVRRRDARFATGTVIFARTTTAPADINLPAGLRISTSDVPAMVFETAEARVLARGDLSAEAPISALVEGNAGVVPAGAIQVMHRPLLGIESLTNPQATRFAVQKEGDEALRERIKRALQAVGKASPGAIIGALARIAGLREKDIRVSEDPIARPGVIEIDAAIADDLNDEERQQVARQALEILDETRPAGIRVLAHIDAPRPVGSAEPSVNIVPDEGDAPVTIGSGESLLQPVDVTAVLVPATLGLSAAEREALRKVGEDSVLAFIEDAGLGETLVYNRLVSRLMTLDGVLDVAVEMALSGSTGPRRKNILLASPRARPRPGLIDVRVGASLVILDVSVSITLKGAGLLDDPTSAKEAARAQIEAHLREAVRTLDAPTLTPAILDQLREPSDTYDVTQLHYQVTYQDAGIRIQQQDVPLPLSGLEQLWVRQVTLMSGTG